VTSAPSSAPRGGTLQLARWTITSGSSVQSRGAVVVRAGGHRWKAAAEGNGPIDALFRAVDAAIGEVLAGHPRLLAYDIHALAEGPDAEGEVRVRIAPPAGAEGARRHGEYEGSGRSTNIIAASIEAYIGAINAMLAESHWEGAATAAGSRRGAAEPASHGERAEIDHEAGRIDTTEWFNG
jgi:2-isopropylmalate synthase